MGWKASQFFLSVSSTFLNWKSNARLRCYCSSKGITHGGNDSLPCYEQLSWVQRWQGKGNSSQSPAGSWTPPENPPAPGTTNASRLTTPCLEESGKAPLWHTSTDWELMSTCQLQEGVQIYINRKLIVRLSAAEWNMINDQSAVRAIKQRATHPLWLKSPICYRLPWFHSMQSL